MNELPPNLEELLRQITSSVDVDSGRVQEEISIKPEWKQMHDEAVAIMKKAEEYAQTAKAIRNKMWASIGLETGHVVNNMKYDEENNVIVVYQSPLYS